MAMHNLAKATYAAQAAVTKTGAKLLFDGTPRFNEFVARDHRRTTKPINAQLLDRQDHRRPSRSSASIPSWATPASGAPPSSPPARRSIAPQRSSPAAIRRAHAGARKGFHNGHSGTRSRQRNGLTGNRQKVPHISQNEGTIFEKSSPGKAATSCRRSTCPKSTPPKLSATPPAPRPGTCPKSAKSKSSATSPASPPGTTPSISACIRWAPAP